MTIGERIKQRRNELGLTQTELASRLGLKSKVSISTVENDKEDLTTDRIKKYAEALETTPAALMGWEETTTFQRRHTAIAKDIDGPNGKVHFEFKMNPDVEEKEMKKLEEAYIAQQIFKRYSDLIGNPQIQRLLLAAEKCDPEQIELAIAILSLKKGE